MSRGAGGGRPRSPSFPTTGSRLIGAYVPVEYVPVIDEVAAARGVTRAALIREALDQIVAAHTAKEEAA